MLDLLAWLLLLPIVPGVGTFVVETALGLMPPRAAGRVPASRFAVLMPAHDEGRTIARFVAELRAGLPVDARLLVVADNCTDDTAQAARAAGAAVIERSDPQRRGKGYALAHGRDHLRRDPPDCVIVLDADCRFEGGGGAAADLAGAALASGRPVQARYLFEGGATVPPMVQISNFALLVKNRVRQRGLARLGAPALLGGTGMAFPWPLFERAALATDDLVEDLALGLALAEAGFGARYRDDIVVVSAPSSERGTLAQRTRWEHGFLATARRHALPLLGRGLRRSRPDLVWTALHLMTPPLALLVALTGGVLLADGLLALLGATAAPAASAALLLALVALLVLTAWMRFGRGTLAGATLLKLPLYILWKLPLYAGFLRGRQRSWVRTERAPPG